MPAVVGQTQRPSDFVPRARRVSPPLILRRICSARFDGSRALARALGIVIAVMAATRGEAQTGQFCTPRGALIGDSVEVRDVEFDGNDHYSDTQLSRVVATKATSALRRFVRPVLGRIPFARRLVRSRRMLRCDRLRVDSQEVTNYYARTGYPGTTVQPSVVSAGRGAVRVSFRIAEQPPVIIEEATLVWVKAPTNIDTAALRRRLYTQVDRVHDETKVLLDRDTIDLELRNHGYPEPIIQFTRDTTIAATRRARVEITVTPGTLVRLGAIDIKSTRRYNPAKDPEILPEKVRPLLGFKTGDFYDAGAFREAQRRIYALGTYVSSNPEPLRPWLADPAHPGDSISNVLVTLLEDKVHSFAPMVGWTNVDCFRTSLQYTDRAFLHTTSRLDVGAQASKIGWGRPLTSTFARNYLCSPEFVTRLFGDPLAQDSVGSSKLNYAVNVTLAQPGAFGAQWVPQVSVYSERKSGYQAFLRETQIGGAVSARRTRSRVTLGASYNLEYGHTDAEPAVLCFVFSACDQDARDQLTGINRTSAIASVSATRERLNDPLLRTKGTLISTELRTSNRWLGSNADLSFNKASIDAAGYWPLFNSGRNVVHLRLRAGIIGGGAKTNRDRLPPPQERFYTGGASSVRGVQENELGSLVYTVDAFTVDTAGDTVASSRPRRVIPVGGNSLFVGNLEYRVPGPLFPNTVQTVLFLDVGRVWTRGVAEAVRFRWIPGIGVRVSTGVGPIQANVGYNPYNRPAGPAYLNQGLSGGPAPLICVSPKDPTSTASCPATYVPEAPKNFWQRLAFTLSIGS